MTTQVVTVGPDDSITTAIERMLRHDVSGLPVVDAAGRLVGMLSDYELLDLVWDGDPDSSEVYQYMTQPVPTVDEDEDLGAVSERFRLFGIRQLPVMRGSHMVGLLSRRDLLAHLCSLHRQATSEAA